MKITDEYGNKYTIDAPLSAGGQGAVFKVDENHKLLVKAIINANNKIIKNEKKYNEFEENCQSFVLYIFACSNSTYYS